MAVCTVNGDKTGPRIISDAAGGAILTWRDPRHGASDIYAQKFAQDGSCEWREEGEPVCQVGHTQALGYLVTDGEGGAIITWYDYRMHSYDIYVRRLGADTGMSSIDVGHADLYQNHPNPFNPSTTIPYYLPAEGRVRIEIYDVSGRRIAGVLDAVKQAGHHKAEWDGTNDQGHLVNSGMYLCKLRANGVNITRKVLILR